MLTLFITTWSLYGVEFCTISRLTHKNSWEYLLYRQINSSYREYLCLVYPCVGWIIETISCKQKNTVRQKTHACSGQFNSILSGDWSVVFCSILCWRTHFRKPGTRKYYNCLYFLKIEYRYLVFLWFKRKLVCI